MRQAIAVKRIGPTPHRVERVKATATAGSLTLPWRYDISAEQNHAFAAQSLVVKLGWIGDYDKAYAGLWVGGILADGSYTYVFASEGDKPAGWPAGTSV